MTSGNAKPDTIAFVEPLGIDGARMFTPQAPRDNRDSFVEAFRAVELADLGYKLGVLR